MDRPEDQRRTIADINSWIANFTHKIKWVFTKDLKPRVLYGIKPDGTIVNINDNAGYPQFAKRTSYVDDYDPISNADRVVTVPVKELWRVTRVVGHGIMDIGVADRTPRIEFGLDLGNGSILTGLMMTSVITLSASQVGAITLPATPLLHWTYDNTVIAKVADENPLPLEMGPGSTVSMVNTAANSEVGDRMDLRVYREIIGVLV